MDYKKHYDLLIQKHGHKTKPSDGRYYERHHIIPCELFPLKRKDPLANSEDNLVYLTGRCHFLAHWLLALMHPTTGLVHAFITMSNSGNNRDYRVTSKMYDAAKRLHSDKVSGEGNPMYNYKWTDEMRKHQGIKAREAFKNPEVKKKLSNSLKKSWASDEERKSNLIERNKSPEKRKAISEWAKRRKVSEETKKKISIAASKPRPWAQGVPKARVTCERCGASVTANTLSRHMKSNKCLVSGEE